MSEFILGLTGLILIVVAWIPETIKSIRSGETIRTEFLLLYFLGSILLTTHAILIADIIFTVLNGLASILSGINLIKNLRG